MDVKVFSDPRKPAYLNFEAGSKPLKDPIAPETLARVRAYRHGRIKEKLIQHDCAALLVYDPLNIRYATDCSDMQIWTMHNPSRYALIFADGPTICFEYAQALHLAEGLPMVDEVRPCISWFYFASGPRLTESAGKWADEIADLMRRHGGGNQRLAVDRIEPLGVDLLRARGITLVEGQELTETARMIKSPDELELMAWTIKVCEAGMWRMRENSLPGKTENEIWAELHYENIRNGGEWIETRLLAIGERTYPWFKECSGHVGKEGDMLSFDTDLIGPYGYCADLSRAWTVGLVRPKPMQKELYAYALEQIMHNWSIIKPGMSFREFNEKSLRMPQEYHENRYGVALHGVGLCDEYPSVPTHVDKDQGKGYDGVFEPGMCLCVESCTGSKRAGETVKLEIQVVVTETGTERLDNFPFEDWA
ncbi:MAG TPA: Xaa-Pro peptidase family protein [Nordella sp.]|nr:Xaa-Pro peptidase family protein [Nordella sp.]